MLEYLFGSKTRLKLLRVFFDNPEKKFFVRELTRLVGAQINSIRRELKHLLGAQVIIPSKAPVGDGRILPAEGLRKYYGLNQDGVINVELQSLLLKAQIWGERQLVEVIKRLGNVEYLVLSGRFTGAKEAPTDLLVVGNTSRKELARLARLFESEFGGEVRYTAMTVKEFLYRRDVADKFLTDLLENNHLVAVDKLPAPYKFRPASL